MRAPPCAPPILRLSLLRGVEMDSWRVAVLGDGGVGKTALAVQARIASRRLSPDGILIDPAPHYSRSSRSIVSLVRIDIHICVPLSAYPGNSVCILSITEVSSIYLSTRVLSR